MAPHPRMGSDVWPARLGALLLSVTFLQACASGPPADAFRLSPTALEDRQLQSRSFDTLDHKQVMAASAHVLQDLGYALDESNTTLGVLTASKTLEATDPGQIVRAVFLAALTGIVSATDDDQQVRVGLVVSQSLQDPDASIVRITMTRIIWDTEGEITRREQLRQPALYQAFFDKLSKATFLEAHHI